MRIVTAMCVLMTLIVEAVVPAWATQIISNEVEYSNDRIEQGGQLQACIVVVTVVNPPAPEIVNFQVLNILGRAAFKVTVGDMNWGSYSTVAKRITTASFSTDQFNYPTAFSPSITPEGQFLGTLTETELRLQFMQAFFRGRYSIQFRRSDLDDERVYYVEKGAPPNVIDSFNACLRAMAQRI